MGVTRPVRAQSGGPETGRAAGTIARRQHPRGTPFRLGYGAPPRSPCRFPPPAPPPPSGCPHLPFFSRFSSAAGPHPGRDGQPGAPSGASSYRTPPSAPVGGAFRRPSCSSNERAGLPPPQSLLALCSAENCSPLSPQEGGAPSADSHVQFTNRSSQVNFARLVTPPSSRQWWGLRGRSRQRPGWGSLASLPLVSLPFELLPQSIKSWPLDVSSWSTHFYSDFFISTSL